MIIRHALEGEGGAHRIEKAESCGAIAVPRLADGTHHRQPGLRAGEGDIHPAGGDMPRRGAGAGQPPEMRRMDMPDNRDAGLGGAQGTFGLLRAGDIFPVIRGTRAGMDEKRRAFFHAQRHFRQKAPMRRAKLAACIIDASPGEFIHIGMITLYRGIVVAFDREGASRDSRGTANPCSRLP